ncbi:hypothetical protein GCM10011516_12750 [Sphingobacterium cellulitidis]|uniref:Uncharacterized protein n=1 Tax=Sphingobacterium cellulitidis TaxID=1768011 RepID=A0A8H9FYS3_9SPHI|nr:hypothetical protein GCM10011516_12750 [Sphingobacterium soli]
MQTPSTYPLQLLKAENEQLSILATYLVFQHTRFTEMHVAMQIRELLPHVFTLTPKGGIFSVALAV